MHRKSILVKITPVRRQGRREEHLGATVVGALHCIVAGAQLKRDPEHLSALKPYSPTCWAENRAMSTRAEEETGPGELWI